MPDPRDEPFDEDAFDDVIDDEVEDDAYITTARTDAVSVDAYAPPQDATVVKRGVGVPLVLLTGIVAAVAGAAGGYGLASTFPPVAPLTDDITELRAELAGLDATDRLSRISERLDAVESRRAPRVDLSPLEARLDALEERPDPVAPVTLREAEPATDPDAPIPAARPALTPALARRLSALERRVAELESETRPSTRTEAAPVASPSPAATAAPTSARRTSTSVSIDDLPPYPFAAVEAAISADEPSTFRRIFKVRDRSTVDALADLRAALDADDIAAALDAHARLPEAAQVEAADWARRARADR